MKLKQTMRYQANEYLRPTVIFYIVIASIYLVMVISARIFFDGSIIGQTNLSSGTVIFLFVMGLNMFKSPFNLMLQNGISRRTQWLGLALSGLLYALAMTAIDSLLPYIFRGVNYVTNYAAFYGSVVENAAALSARGIAWTWASYMAAFSFGYLLTTLYYRMNKPLKVIVSIGVPGLLFVVLPIVEVIVPSFNLFSSLVSLVSWAMGYDKVTGSFGYRMVLAANGVWRAAASYTVVSAAMLGCAYLLMRRATMKES